MIKGIIFDFDGTLTPLNLDFAYLKEEISNIARKYTTEEVIRKTDDDYVLEMIYNIAGMLNNSSETDRFQKEAFKKLRSLEFASAADKDLYPYARDVLNELKIKNIKTGIISRNCTDVIRSVFSNMDDYISVIITRENTRHIKPDPRHALEALAIMGVSPGSSMMVGDHPTDVITGIRAGMTTAGVLVGKTLRDDFKKIGTNFIIEDIRDILNLRIITG